MLVNPQPAKAPSPISVTVDGIFILVIFKHEANTPLPITVTVSGMLKLVSVSQEAKACSQFR